MTQPSSTAQQQYDRVTRQSFDVLNHPQKTELHSGGDLVSSTETDEEQSFYSEMELYSPDATKILQKSVPALKDISIYGTHNQVFHLCNFKFLQGAEVSQVHLRTSEISKEAVDSVENRGLSSQTHVNPTTQIQYAEPPSSTISATDTDTNLNTSVELQFEQLSKELHQASERCHFIKSRLTKIEEENKQLKQENELLKHEIISLKNNCRPSVENEDTSGDISAGSNVQSSVFDTSSKEALSYDAKRISSIIVNWSFICVILISVPYYYFGISTELLFALIPILLFTIASYRNPAILEGPNKVDTDDLSLASLWHGYDAFRVDDDILTFGSSFQNEFLFPVNSISADNNLFSELSFMSMIRELYFGFGQLPGVNVPEAKSVSSSRHSWNPGRDGGCILQGRGRGRRKRKQHRPYKKPAKRRGHFVF